jgi:hypothetical protein
MQEPVINTADISRAQPEVAAGWLDRHPGLVILLVCAAYGLFSIPVSLARPLWHDELFTYYLALYPSVPSMLHAVLKVDLNPPLLYLLDFLTLRLPGALANEHTASLAARLPSIVGGLVASLGLFVWLRRRLRSFYALAGVGVLWNTTFLFYTAEDRPYALLVGITILMMLSRESALEQKSRPLWLLENLLLGFALVACHFMAAFVLLAFLAAEGVQSWQRRKLDIPLILCYLLPFSVLVVYHSMISGYGTMIFPRTFTPALDTPFVAYAVLGYYAWFFFLPAALIVSGRYAITAEGRLPKGGPTHFVHWIRSRLTPERTLLLALLLEPVLAIAAIWRSQGAFFPRYGLPGCIPIAIAVTFLLHRALRSSRAAGVVTLLLLCAHPAYTVLTNPALLRPGQIAGVDPGPSRPDYHTVETDLPFVVASGLTYVEMNSRESPAFLHRVYYLTDDAAATEYAHATLFEHEEVIREMFHFHSRVDTLQQFESEHRQFLVLGTFDYPEDWLLRKLRADGDKIRFLGEYPTSYKDSSLYEVTLPPSASQAQDH